MENIKIYNHFLTEDELITCKNIVSSNSWKFGQRSNTENILDIPFWDINLLHNHFLNTIIKEKIEVVTNKKYKILRLYANGQTYGQNGSFHQDMVSNHHITPFYTFCLYLTEFPDNIADYVGGQIEIKLPNITDYNIQIQPKFNRGVLFPSTYFHRGCSFSRFDYDLRICIAWKLEEI
jgi:hypothetical protein